MKPTGSIIAAAGGGILIGAILTGVIVTSFSANTPDVQKSDQNRSGDSRGTGRRQGRSGYTPTVAMAVAKSAPLAKTIEVLGEARALKSVAITSEVTGLVQTINVAPGKRMKQGDILLEIASDAQSIALSRARAQFPIAKANAERYRALVEENAGSALEAEEAFNRLKTLEAELRSAELALEQRTIKAPFDGIAGITTIEIGDYVRAGDIITTLDDTNSIVVEFSVPQESAAYVALNQPVSARLTSNAGIIHKGIVTAIDSRIDSTSRTLKVEATVENHNGRLLPGAVFTVSTTKNGENAISVPGLAVQWDRAGAYVWKRDAEGNATRASIVILQRTDEIVLVEGNIAEGDAIAADGADRIRAGLTLPKTTPSNNTKPKAARGSNAAVE